MLFLKLFYRNSIRQLVLQARYTPRIQMASLSEYKLKDLKSLDLKSGEKREVEVEGIEEAKVLLVNTGGKTTALGAKCTHYGAPLVKGVLTGDGRLTCPWHGGML
jgi:nitrite reductase/ring-hydroxylating ferredoxin subunit